MGKEGVQELAFKEYTKTQAEAAIFGLSVFKRDLINDYVYGKTQEPNPFKEHNDNPLEGAKKHLGLMEKVTPIIRDYFKLTGRKFNLGHSSVTPAGAGTIFYDPDLGCLAYAFAPGRRPAVLSESLLDRLYKAKINLTAVETFGRLSGIQLIDEIMLAIKHPTLKSVKDTLHKAI